MLFMREQLLYLKEKLVILTDDDRPWVAGIAPGPQGAYSIALSGGYDDDVDLGNGL